MQDGGCGQFMMYAGWWRWTVHDVCRTVGWTVYDVCRMVEVGSV